MKNIVLFFALSFVFIGNSQAQVAPIRQAKLTVVIEKVVFKFADNGFPTWIRTPLCTKQSLINVYNEDENGNWSSLGPADLKVVQCDGELEGKMVSVTVGAALRMFPMPVAGGILNLKGTALFLAWGKFDSETTKIVHSTSSDPWLNFLDILSPVSTGKVIDGVPQAPEPAEFFSASVTIEDGIH